MSWTAYERETIISLNDHDKTVYIYTAQKGVIEKLRRHPYAVELSATVADGCEQAEFEIPKDKFDVVKGIKRVPSQRQLNALAVLREANKTRNIPGAGRSENTTGADLAKAPAESGTSPNNARYDKRDSVMGVQA